MKHFIDHLKDFRIFLASRSPRRQHLLAEMGIPFQVWLKEEIMENYPDGLEPVDVARFLAAEKAGPYLADLGSTDILITADTIVVVDDRIVGKPADRTDALRILTELAGRPHEVITAVGLWSDGRNTVFDSRTRVWFDHLNHEEIEEYVDIHQPYDKAGAYGIQEWIGYVAITRIEGSFYNVMGLPIQRLYRELQFFTNYKR
jgi:septum formation protein